ncbi:MAG TPA: hypothetical protein VK448_05345 [Dissulfurispiraceae bacterium]|nr:hypothetical protein [Dissulfurispiraceae bacterium]
MCSETDNAKKIACPHLKCCNNISMCSVAMEKIRNITDADIRFCTGRHYEACHLYFKSIREAAITSPTIHL